MDLSELPTDPWTLGLAAGCLFTVILLLMTVTALRGARRARREVEARLSDMARRADELGERHGLIAQEKSRLEEAVSRLEAGLRDAVDRYERLEDRHTRLQEDHGGLQSAHAALKADSSGRLESAEREFARLAQLREEMSSTFKQLATDTLTTQSTAFGETNKERMEALLTPVREQVEHFRKELTQTRKGASEERLRLEERIRQLSDRSAEISREAVALTNALKGEKQKQGAWGEMILESVLESSGLKRGREFETQFSVTDEGRRFRPDAVIRLPGGRNVVIDAKVSLVAYEAASNAETPEDRATHVRAHLLAVQKHINDLAERDYSNVIEGAVDYTLMFMPIEPALAMALEEQEDLTARATARRVFIVSPTTLMLALRTIEYVWTIDTREKNATLIADRAGKLYDKVAGFCENMEKVGRQLDAARDAHAAAFDQLSRGRGNVLGQVQQLQDLGARTKKSIEVDFDRSVETFPRAVPES